MLCLLCLLCVHACMQSVGLLLGVATMNPKTAQTIASVVLMIMVRRRMQHVEGDAAAQGHPAACRQGLWLQDGGAAPRLCQQPANCLRLPLLTLQMLTGGFFVTNIPIW